MLRRPLVKMTGIVAAATLVAACGQGSGGSSGAPQAAVSTPSSVPPPAARAPGTVSSASPSATATASPKGSLFVVVMENRSFGEAMAQPYTAQLAAQFAVATDYYAVSHPSLPNYLALTSGSTWGITDDGYHALPQGGLGHQLSQAGVSWKAYMEGMTAGCRDSPSPYALKHNPFAYYGGSCPGQVVPMTQLDGDLAGHTPSFVWITPDLCHDGHDCSSAMADTFLSGLVPKILASAAWREGGVLFLTWDEDDGSAGNRVPLIVASQNLALHQTTRRHDHYSLLATVEDRLGVPRLGQAQQATPLAELFG
jgi:phospholipase C